MAAFELDADARLLGLSRRLLAGSYRPDPYRIKIIKDPKPRLIAVAPVRDRVVQTAVYQGLAPLFDMGFSEDSYACLPGRGSHRALLRFQEAMRRFPFMMHLDIRCYYPSVDHRILLNLLAPQIRDTRVVALLEVILASGQRLYQTDAVQSFYPDLGDGRPRGLPIGNLTSQWWGNLYLNELDHFIKRGLKAPAYCRYMDDLVLFGADRSCLRDWRTQIASWLADHRALRLNPNKGHIRATNTTQTWLGYRVSPWNREPGKKMVARFRHALPAVVSEGRLRARLVAWKGLFSW